MFSPECIILSYLADPTDWKKKFADERKRTLSLEDKLNKLKLQLDQHQRRVVSQLERRQEKNSVPRRLVSIQNKQRKSYLYNISLFTTIETPIKFCYKTFTAVHKFTIL